MKLDEEWNYFLKNNSLDNNIHNENNNIQNEENINDEKFIKDNNNEINEDLIIPEASKLYISTKTKIIYLNTMIDIYYVFWKINIIDYDLQEEGIIKKQIKISSITKEDLIKIEELTNNEKNVYINIINHIDNPDGRIKFKDIRKISIGISKKDILYTKSKDKSAFYNCFVVTLRIKQNNIFKEFHIKIFNTGKLEIPGIQDDISLEIIINTIINVLKNIINANIYYLKDKTENVLINSNFNCGFYINREQLFNILRYKYNLNANYDSCSYPGIQCIYYHNDENKTNDINDTINKNVKISFMIFRTGSILIVGKCDEIILDIVYNYIKDILQTEYENIVIKNIENDKIIKKTKQIKFKKKTIIINN